MAAEVNNTQWTCITCSYKNQSHNKLCAMCEIPKPASKPNHTKKWQCQLCTFINSISKSKCEICNGPSSAETNSITTSDQWQNHQNKDCLIKQKAQNKEWRCTSCSTLNRNDRNNVPCTNCHILQSDINIKRAKELYILGNISNPSVCFIPLKVPFFIYPLSPPVVQYTIQYEEKKVIINLEVELWDSRHIENYHIESIKINSYLTGIKSSTIINNKTPYYNIFPFHVKKYKSGFQTIEVYAKCDGSVRISPKRSLKIFLSPSNTQQTSISTSFDTKRKLGVIMLNDCGDNAPSKKRRKLASNSNTNHGNFVIDSASNNKSKQTEPINQPIVSTMDNSKEEAEDKVVRCWYFKNDDGNFQAISDDLSQTISTMKQGETKIITFRNRKYCMKKIAYNQCAQKNTKTKKVRKLRLEEYAWFYQDNNGLFNPCSDKINFQLSCLDIGKSFEFSLNNDSKYKVTKLSMNNAKQTNLKTGFERIVMYELIFIVNDDDDLKKNVTSKQPQQTDNNHEEQFVSHMSYQEALRLQIGDEIDIRHRMGRVYAAKICRIEIRENGKNSMMQTFINAHYKGCQYDEWINIDIQWFRLAAYKSISRRPNHRLNDLRIGDFIDVNPIYLDRGWKPAEIINMSTSSGQIEVKFNHSISKQSISYWLHLDNTIECAQFGKGHIDEKQVEALFFMTVSPSKYQIIEIKNISNRNSINVYESILRGKEKAIHEIEKYLWHGMRNIDVLQSILKNGFDRSYNKMGKYGKGTYFAKHAIYSVERGFCGKDENGLHLILLNRVITDEYIEGNRNMITIPKRTNGMEYDSLVNNKDNPQIFVSWRDYHAIPYYLIKFKCLS